MCTSSKAFGRHEPSKLAGFTLVELLVVIGIIALLISILLPALSKARQSALKAACLSNQKQVLLAILMYAGDNQGILPGPAVPVVFDPYTTNATGGAPYAPITLWNGTGNYYEVRELSSMMLVQKYLGGVNSRKVWFCPAASDAVTNATPVLATSAFFGHQLGYGFMINSLSSGTGCYPPFLFGSYSAGDSIADKTPKKLTQCKALASEYATVYTQDATRVWLVTETDGRNMNTNASASFGIVTVANMTSAKNALPLGLQPVHRINNGFPKGLARNYGFLDGHCQTLGFYDWPGEQGIQP